MTVDPQLTSRRRSSAQPIIRVPLVRALRERRAMRQLQASSSHVLLSRRWAAAAAAAAAARCPTKRAQQLGSPSLPRATEPSPAAVSTMRPSGGFHTAAPVALAPAPAPATSTTATPGATTAAAAAVAAAAATTTTSAEAYFRSLLRARGRSPAPTKLAFQQPTPKQVHDYGLRPFVSDLARKGDIGGLQKAMDAGRGMDASNKFGETVVHIACRRGNLDVLRFLVANGGSLTACDDLGRFPLHEVCWATQPCFDIVRVFLEEERRTNARRRRRASDENGGNGEGGGGSGDEGGDGDGNGDLTMLLAADSRGCSPLRYVKPESWPLWHRFLDEVVDEFWPSVSPSSQ